LGQKFWRTRSSSISVVNVPNGETAARPYVLAYFSPFKRDLPSSHRADAPWPFLSVFVVMRVAVFNPHSALIVLKVTLPRSLVDADSTPTRRMASWKSSRCSYRSFRKHVLGRRRTSSLPLSLFGSMVESDEGAHQKRGVRRRIERTSEIFKNS
jgi:hypothetical protein